MTKARNNRISRLLFFYAIVIFILAIFLPKELDWRPSFSKNHRIPYGAEAFYQGLEDLIGGQKIGVSDVPLSDFLKEDSLSNSQLIIIAEEFLLDSLSLESLKTFVRSGNDVFIAAEHFNFEFENALGIQVNKEAMLFENIEGEFSEFTLNHKKFDNAPPFQFKPSVSQTYFHLPDSANTSITSLGKMGTETNFVRIKIGDGEILLHGFPTAFSNYYFLKKETRPYLEGCLSYMNIDAERVIWDEYYKPMKTVKSQSPLGVLLIYPSFRWAYWLTIVGLGLYIVFAGKRRQRPIPIMVSPRNEQVNFIKTLSNLYYNKGSHKNLTEKKVQVFKEFLASVYGMKDIEFTAREAKLLHEKSGKDAHLIDSIFKMIKLNKETSSVSEYDLKVLVDRINKFYDRNK